MQLPSLGQNLDPNQNLYQDPEAASKKKMFLLIGGGVLVIILLLIVVFSGGNKAGKEDMQGALQSTSEAIGIMDQYDDKLNYTPTKNNIALVQILLRGNYQKLNLIYNKTYKPRKKFSGSPKPDKASITTLDRADRNNTLDSELTKVLLVKVQSADKKLVLVKPSIKSSSSKASINDSISDMHSIEDLLNSPQ